MNKKKKGNKQKIKAEIDENKIKENISQNTLSIIYTIYIIFKYYPNCNKIGIPKITLFDKNGNVIPINALIQTQIQIIGQILNLHIYSII